MIDTQIIKLHAWLLGNVLLDLAYIVLSLALKFTNHKHDFHYIPDQHQGNLHLDKMVRCYAVVGLKMLCML